MTEQENELRDKVEVAVVQKDVKAGKQKAGLTPSVHDDKKSDERKNCGSRESRSSEVLDRDNDKNSDEPVKAPPKKKTKRNVLHDSDDDNDDDGEDKSEIADKKQKSEAESNTVKPKIDK